MKLTSTDLTLSATDLANHLTCRHLTGLELARARGEIDRPEWRDPKVQTLAELGLRHERAYVEHLRNQGKSVKELSDAVGDGQAPAEKTPAAMGEGYDVITQATLADGAWHGRADVLLKTNVASDLGDWSYEVADTKLSANTKGGTVLQLCLYSDLVGRLQGQIPKFMYVVPPSEDFAPEIFRFDDYAAYYRQVRERLVDTVTTTDGQMTYPYPVPHCDICRWWSVCDKKRHDDDHLSLVAGMTRLHTMELEERGCQTLEAFVGFPAFKPSRGSRETFDRLREQARVQLQARNEKRPIYELLDMQPGEGLHRLPEPSPGDVYFDIEGDRFVGRSGLEYLFGVSMRKGDGLVYTGRWSLNEKDERRAFEELVDWLTARYDADRNMHIYHYNHYEPTALKRLMSRYGSREDDVDRLLRAQRFVDLYSIVRQSIRAGVESYSLKNMEPFYGFERTVDLREDAAPNLRMLERALELGQPDAIDTEVRAAVEGYNREDCESTAFLHAWLEERRAEYAAAGHAIERPKAESGEPRAKVREKLEEIRRLAGLLTENLPKSMEDSTAEERSRWLLANLLEWHHRESKVTAWEYFRMIDLTEEEMLEEPSAISGLRNHVRVNEEERLDAYEYPQQDVKLTKGTRLKAPGNVGIGKIAEIDPVSRVVTIEKLKTRIDIHPTAVFGHDSYPTESMEKSLQRIAEFVIREGVDSSLPEYACGRRLLRLQTPRALSLAPTDGVAQSKLDLACDMGLQLDGDFLAIQGPPGSGKTYTGAHMISALVKAGKTVGVTATSHKVIRNLLDKVVEIADETEVDVRCVQKPKKGTTKKAEDEDPQILETQDDSLILGAIASGDRHVAAGTSWLWSKPDFHEAVDVLFVDEAGQMSLANVLAVSQGARNLVLLGDPAQLDQPQKASHPEGTDVAALDYVLGDAEIMPPDRGLFINVTRRLHPAICEFTSELFYKSELNPLDGLENQRIVGHPQITESGLYFYAVDHEGNRNESLEEAEAVKSLVESLVGGGVTWINSKRKEAPLGLDEVLVVAPFNAHVTLLQTVLPEGARVGTVDKFQGQEAPVVIYSFASSSPEDAPRGLEFLYSLNRLNVATSRARCACIVVASPRLLEAECRTPRQMKLVNALCRYREMSREIAT